MVRLNEYQHLKVILKPTLLFFSANVFVYSLHELSHALTAYFFKIDSTLFHFYVNMNPNIGLKSEYVIIAIAGPISSFCLGIIFWFIYKKTNTMGIKLFSLYAAIVGISILFGNLFSTRFAGDFNRAAILMSINSTEMLIITIIGLGLLILFMYNAGNEFLIFKIHGINKANLVIFSTIIVPCIIGSSLIIFSYLPLPDYFITGIISSSLFWIFSFAAAFKNRDKERIGNLYITSINSFDIVLGLISVLLIRFLVSGINFAP